MYVYIQAVAAEGRGEKEYSFQTNKIRIADQTYPGFGRAHPVVQNIIEDMHTHVYIHTYNIHTKGSGKAS